MSVPAPPGDDLPARLRLALTAALRARDMTAAAALRSALGAIGNAEAVPVPAAPPATGGPHVAGATPGLGAAEAERRRLSPAQVAAIVRAEIDERLTAAAQYERAGRADRAARLAAEARALASAVGGRP
jgi:uncharacterized protein